MKLKLMAAALLVMAACAPKPAETAKAPEPATPAPATDIAPDVAASMANGTGDPRIPTVDPASITDKSPVGDVMHAFVIPGSETLFAAETEGAPTDDAGWGKLQKGAADVIHGAELLKASGRSKGKDWDATVDTVIT